MEFYQPTTIDCRNAVFETADLTKIHGEPTLVTLLTLHIPTKLTTYKRKKMFLIGIFQ
jgi:hypothetical protein